MLIENNFRVAVVGAGGTGVFYGGALARAGADVTMIARGPHLEAIKKKKLSLKSVLLGDFVVECSATDDMSSIEKVDLVIFAVKSWSTDNAIEAMKIAHMVDEETIIISTQNGIDSELQLSRAFGRDHIVGCSAAVSAMISEPGIITQNGGPGSLVLGELNGGSSDRVDNLVERCLAAGLAAESHDNIELALWQKFAVICALSGMTALTRKPLGEIFAHESTTEMYRQVLDEVAAVGRIQGIPLDENMGRMMLAALQGRSPLLMGSMGHDLKAGKPIEIGLLNGRVVEIGKQHGVPTPANFAIEAALRPYELGTRVKALFL